MVADRHWKPLVLKWSALTELLTLMLFFLIASLIEYVIIIYSLSIGVNDQNVLSYTLTFPGTSWTFTLTISPLFHLVPLGVVVCLVSSWTYLTRRIAVAPQRVETRQRKVKRIKREGKDWLKPLKKFGAKISRKLSKFWSRMKSWLLETRGVSFVWQKIFFARAAIKSALTIIFVFAVLVLAGSLMASPLLLPKWVKTLYMDYSAFRGLVTATVNWAGSIANVLPPLRWIASGINSVLLAIAPGFRHSFEGLGALTAPLAKLDPAGKYVFYQNFAAWVSCLISLLYGQYVTKRHRRRRF